MNRVFGMSKKHVDKTNGERIFNWILVGIGLLIAVVVSVLFYIRKDTEPATPEDYESLVNRVLLIQDDPTKMLQEDGNIIMSGDEILLILENNECKIRASFNRNFQLQTMEKKDKAFPVTIVLVVSILLGVSLGVLCASVIKLIQTIIIATKELYPALGCKLKKKDKEH